MTSLDHPLEPTKKMLRLSPTESDMVVASDVSRDVTSPVLVVSKNPISCPTTAANSLLRMRMFSLGGVTRSGGGSVGLTELKYFKNLSLSNRR